MPHIAALRKVALDTTVVRHFHDAGFLVKLALYLRGNAFVVEDVHRELSFQAKTRPDLNTVLHKHGWPRRFGGQLPKALIKRGLGIQDAWLKEGDRADAHLGEIYTVLGAAHFKADLVITNDRDGFNLAKAEDLAVIRAGELIAEMVAEARLTPEEGWAIYQRTRKKPKRANYDALVASARTDKAARDQAAAP